MGEKLPSPCIDICKFKREGRCIGCSMNKADKKAFKKLSKPKHQRQFIDALLERQAEMGKYTHWANAYRRKCAKKSAPCVLD
ncbi:MAG: DUF1289 domain-containing protein [Neomegalonema sp.]|nr:DUF1289 domain-containing protein [Neomegalonema sp.]